MSRCCSATNRRALLAFQAGEYQIATASGRRGGDLLGATKKLELPGSCQLKGRPSQTNPEERTTDGRDAPSFLPSSSRVFALSWGWRFPCFGVCPSRRPSPAVSTSETRRKMGWRFIRPVVREGKKRSGDADLRAGQLDVVQSRPGGLSLSLSPSSRCVGFREPEASTLPATLDAGHPKLPDSCPLGVVCAGCIS